MIVKLLTKHHLEFLGLKGGCRGSSESTHVKMPHCWKSHAAAQMLYARYTFFLKGYVYNNKKFTRYANSLSLHGYIFCTCKSTKRRNHKGIFSSSFFIECC